MLNDGDLRILHTRETALICEAAPRISPPSRMYISLEPSALPTATDANALEVVFLVFAEFHQKTSSSTSSLAAPLTAASAENGFDPVWVIRYDPVNTKGNHLFYVGRFVGCPNGHNITAALGLRHSLRR